MTVCPAPIEYVLRAAVRKAYGRGKLREILGYALDQEPCEADASRHMMLVLCPDGAGVFRYDARRTPGSRSSMRQTERFQSAVGFRRPQRASGSEPLQDRLVCPDTGKTARVQLAQDPRAVSAPVGRRLPKGIATLRTAHHGVKQSAVVAQLGHGLRRPLRWRWRPAGRTIAGRR